jgi:GntR family transcriptional regulator, carbon starvation induced regulator
MAETVEKDDIAQPEEGSGQTQTSIAYRLMRNDIISSVLPAGSKLRIRDLCERYDLSMSAIREALNRLMRDGLVQLVDLRGFSVSPMTRIDLDDLTKARCWVNEKALRESILRGDTHWEERIVIAFYRLSRAQKFMSPSDTMVSSAWETAHRAFHASLISACGSQWIIGFSEQLFDAADRYRHLSRAAFRNREEDHKEIMEATIAREADKAADLLNKHFERTAELGRIMLESATQARPGTAQRRPS